MSRDYCFLSIQPTKPGYDFNDVLKEQGIGGVRAFLQGIEPHTEKDKSLS